MHCSSLSLPPVVSDIANARGLCDSQCDGDVSYLDEANVGGLLTEALTADVEAVLADETGLVGADTAVKTQGQQVSEVCPMLLSNFVFPLALPIPPSSSWTIYSWSHVGLNVPATGALAVLPRARVPDRFVRHDCGLCG